MKIVAIGEKDAPRLELFLRWAGSSLATFRYFSSRPFSVLRNHVITALGLEDEMPVAYGHLDRDEDGRTWLGICVVEGAVGRGLGRQMMQALVDRADVDRRELYLAVDESNVTAKRLYENFGFVVVDTINGVVRMRRAQVADTFGMLVDKLATVNQKMFVNQEILYEIRRMTFADFKQRFLDDPKGAERLWETLKKACDLNVQRNALIAEVDEKIVEIVTAATEGDDLDNGSFIQRQHKTY